MKVAKLFAVLVITALVLGLAGTAAAAPPAENPGKGPPEFAKVVFIHYAKGFAPAKSSGSEAEGYIYSGYHWSERDMPVHYLVNLAGSGGDNTFTAGSVGMVVGTSWKPYMDVIFSRFALYDLAE